MDEQPCYIRTRSKPLVVVPYSVELNDIAIMMLQHHDARILYERTMAQFERLYQEGHESHGYSRSASTRTSAACLIGSGISNAYTRSFRADPASCSGPTSKFLTGTGPPARFRPETAADPPAAR